VQLGTRVLTNFEINLAPSLLNFVRQAVQVPLVFLNYHRPGLLFADFGDAKTLVRWIRNHIGLLLSWRCWVTCQCPALDSLLDSFYTGGGVVSHLQGFPTFRVLASTRVPIYICPNKAEVSKRQYSSKAKSYNIHDSVFPEVQYCILGYRKLRTLKFLAFDEYCRFDTSALFSGIK
jgi:hypothetical protein